MVWDKPQILKALKKLYKEGADLSYNALAKKYQPLVSAAAYHFGSYRSAVEKAGVDYAGVARRTDELVASLPDLDESRPLPKAPWFPAGERWSARRVLLHVAAETAQHAGHADIVREALDGAKSMG